MLFSTESLKKTNQPPPHTTSDAIGAPLEFKPVQYGSRYGAPREVTDMGGPAWSSMRFFLKPGQWTDDASMALCIADSLLLRSREQGLDCRDLRLRFLNWWDWGYNNAFPNDPERGRSSVGLGGNISMSFGEFQRNRGEFTTAGDENTSGNGSVMRNSPVPCRYWNDTTRAMAEAERQSYTTHRGTEAAQCARLLTFVCTRAAQMRANKPTAQQVLSCLAEFESPLYSVQCLAASKNEERHPSNEKFELVDRAWNWKDPDHRFSPLRAQQMPGYVGSYCMDACAMALHCVWTTDSFSEAVLKAVNMRGDSDSYGAVCAQMAGAIYGVSSIPQNWIRVCQQWDDGLSALKAYKLWAGKVVPPPSVEAIRRLNDMDEQALQFELSSTQLTGGGKKKK